MSRIGHGALFLISILLLVRADAALAQDNYEAGKKPAQMFATDCGLCHKSPIGLGKTPGMFGLESFLREHYTASREAAAAIAGYLRSVNAAQPPPRAATRRRKTEPASKAADRPPGKREQGKPAEAKPAGAGQGGAEPKADAKSGGEKPAEPKAAEPKPAEPKPEPKAEPKAAEPKPAEAPAAPAPPAAKPE
jgi:hypothetical protein